MLNLSYIMIQFLSKKKATITLFSTVRFTFTSGMSLQTAEYNFTENVYLPLPLWKYLQILW